MTAKLLLLEFKHWMGAKVRHNLFSWLSTVSLAIQSGAANFRVLLASGIWLLLSLPVYPAGATTRGALRADVNAIIIHAISGPACRNGKVVFSGAPGGALRWKRFFDQHPLLGVHYIVDRQGVTAASTPESRIANHALGNNERSIGIELVHTGDGIEPFGEAQMRALIGLIRSIRRRIKIPISQIRGHAEVDGRVFLCGNQRIKRKQDPGANFPWREFRKALTEDDQPKLLRGPQLRRSR